MFEIDPTENMMRCIRSSAVSQAMETHKDRIPEQERGSVHEIVSLAVHLALLQFKAQHEMQYAEMYSWMRLRSNEAMLRAPSMFIPMEQR